MLSCAAGLFIFASALQADPAVTFTDPGTQGTNGAWSIGWMFSTNTDIQVNALGYYNASLAGGDSSFANGTCNCGEVGIFDSTGNLLASTTVTAGGSLEGLFNYGDIAPITLASGQTYVIAAETGSSDYAYYTGGFTVNPNINFIQDEYLSSSTLAFPTDSSAITAADGGGWFGPNFESTTATPEPSYIAAVTIGMLVMGMVAWKKRNRPASAVSM